VKKEKRKKRTWYWYRQLSKIIETMQQKATISKILLW